MVALNWLGGDPEAINRMTREHSWDWPRYPVADIEAEANSRDKRLRNGTLTLEAAYAEDGKDFDDALERMAANYGVTVDEMREHLRTTIFARLSVTGTFPLGEQPEQMAIETDAQ